MRTQKQTDCPACLVRKRRNEMILKFSIEVGTVLFYVLAATVTMWAIFYTIAEYGFNGGL